ncbi:MAG: flagellar hook-basal body complex protein FliE [Gammaproteobacteria bacterium]|nr:flagellar hook-basal body complex protein FliE [Pseudomonadales bacterium]MCP5349053.1 flagellar hook-basal body complex protein FliE [Pseudomonadales bacterium]
MSDVNIDQVLNQMRILAQNNVVPELNTTDRPDFAALLNDSIKQVNNLQSEARELRDALVTGKQGVDLPEVMVAAEKASVSFEAMTEVRNKLLSAYQEVMNMQI